MLILFDLFSYHKLTNTIIPLISVVYSMVTQHVFCKSLDIPKNYYCVGKRVSHFLTTMAMELK